MARRYSRPADVARLLADRFEISLPTAFRYLREQRLPLIPIRVGPSVKYRTSAVEKVIADLETQADAA